MSAAAISTAKMLRNRHDEIIAEFPAVVVFDEAQQASVMRSSSRASREGAGVGDGPRLVRALPRNGA
jgi:hypothetical protein